MHNDFVEIQRKDDWSNTDGAVCAVRLNDGITLKRILFDHHRQQVHYILSMLNTGFR